MIRIAVIADIHGNYPALEAVAREIERQQPDYVVLNGDMINGTPMNVEVLDFVQTQDWIVIRGNHEFYYLDFDTERARPEYSDPERWGQLHWLVDQISVEHGHFMAMLPDERVFYLPNTQALSIAHGVSGQNTIGFSHRQQDEEIASRLDHVPQHTVVSAHTHIQIDRHVRKSDDRAWHVINPGSVGLPLTKNPQAQFAIIESVDDAVVKGGWSVEHFGVEYDRRPLLEAYTTSGMLEAGGVMSRLFMWEICTAEPEIILFFRWSHENGFNPNEALLDSFRAYSAATNREQYVNERNPLFNRAA